MSQPDEDAFNVAPDPAPADPYDLDGMREWPTSRLRAFIAPSACPATPAGGSASITTETPGPA